MERIGGNEVNSIMAETKLVERMKEDGECGTSSSNGELQNCGGIIEGL